MTRLLAWFGFGFFCVLIGFGATLWFTRAKIETKVFDALIKKISPSLPFTIENYQVGKDLDSLSLEIRFHGETIHLNGPLKWVRLKKEGINLTYTPEVSIEGASAFLMSVTAHTQRTWTRLEALDLEVPKTAFVWKKYGIDTQGFGLNGNFDGHNLKGKLSFKQLAWTEALHTDHAINVSNGVLDWEIPEVKDPQEFKLQASAKSSEVLWGTLYLDLPLSKFPLTINSRDSKTIEVEVGHQQFNATLTPDSFSSEAKTAVLDFNLQRVDVSELLPWVAKNLGSEFSFFSTLSDYEVKSGWLATAGQVKLNAQSKHYQIERLKIALENLTLRSALKKLSVHDFIFHTDYDSRKPVHLAEISARALAYQHFVGSLKPVTLKWNADGFSSDLPLPLTIQDLPLSIGKLTAKFKPEFDLKTSLKLSGTTAEPFATGFCTKVEQFPPMTITGDFPEIEVSKSVIDPTGKMNISLFDGDIELNELGIYNLDTEVPETDFDVDWSNISLEKFTAWSKFGEIKGTIEGYAHDVVVQGLLPTQYHFLFNIAPRDRVHTTGRVEFSPEAMKNVVKIFTGADLDQQIPGVAGWLMFGWPSHLIGGYDVYYAGLKLTSEEGHIIVETLDKPGIFEMEQKHFVIYGTRFKMPLKNTTYPLIVDAASMSNFVHQLFGSLTAIRHAKELKEGIQHEEGQDNPCDPPEL